MVGVFSRGDDLAGLRDCRPDVVLLTGGTDGGNAGPIREAAKALVDSGWNGPVVVAGNVGARDDVGRILGAVPHVLAHNVVPRIGMLAPDSARSAVREMFLAHVIGFAAGFLYMLTLGSRFRPPPGERGGRRRPVRPPQVPPPAPTR